MSTDPDVEDSGWPVWRRASAAVRDLLNPDGNRAGWLSLLRTVTFIVALTALLLGARGGTSRAGLLLLLVVFIVVATVWVHSQYVDSLTRPGVSSVASEVIAGSVLAGVGAVVLVISAVDHAPGAVLAGAVVSYFGCGTLVMTWRKWERPRRCNPLAAEILLVVGLVSICVGFASLGDWNVVLSAVLIAVPLLFAFPIGLQLASEWGIDYVHRQRAAANRDRLPLLAGVGGFVIFAAVTVGAAWLVHSVLLAGVFVVLGLVVVAVASSTWADLAAVFVVIAVLGVTPYQPGLPGGLVPGGGKHVLVALGDSYMSGEGASVYFRGTDEGGGDRCHRSPTAWAAIAGQQSPFDRLAFLACSGASTNNVYLEGIPAPQSFNKEMPQLKAYKQLKSRDPFTPGLVVLTLGGNDAGFGMVGQMCLAPGNCADERKLLIDDRLPQVQTALEHTYDQISAVFPDTPVLVVGYPDPIAAINPDHPGCGQLTFTVAERRFVKTFVSDLDHRIRMAATSRHFYYLNGSQQALARAHLQLCDNLNDGHPGLNFIGLRSVRGDPEQRFNPENWIHNSFHPNERGHQAILRLFETWVATHRNPTARTDSGPVTDPAPAKVASAVAPSPPCEIIGATPQSSCVRLGQKWALQQLGDAMWPWGLLLALLATGGAWAASVALFGWRRRD